MRVCLFILLTITTFCYGQQTKDTKESVDPNPDKIRVFIDCQVCDVNDFKQNIQFVHYVRDKRDADVYLMITEIKTGSGFEYTYFITGLGQFSGQTDTLTLNVSSTETAAEAKNQQIKIIKAALVPFILKTPWAGNLEILVSTPKEPVKSRSNWNNWVFDLGLSGYYSWDQNYTERSLWSNFSVTKLNHKIKSEWTFVGKTFGNTYKYDGYVYETENEEFSMNGLLVGSLSDHWSLGFQSKLLYSTYSNYDLSAAFFPSIEYNFFSYSKATRKQLSLLYGIGGTYNEYIDATIFDQKQEVLYSQKLSLAFKLIEDWGNISMGIQGSNYFHDTDYNRLTLSTDTRLRVFKGFFVKMLGGISIIHDQINLPASGIEYEQLLLQQKEILSSYYYWLQLGVSFTFGDIYSSIVNPRFTQLF